MSIKPSILKENYRSFLSDERILLTGHSHQAWPDCARDALNEGFDHAAQHVDDKWSFAFQKADRVRRAIGTYFDVDSQRVALGQNTHELFCRYLSCLPENRRHVVVSEGEFHSVSRQLRALEGQVLSISWVETHPVETLVERMLEHVREDTGALICSWVLFHTATIVPHLDQFCEVLDPEKTSVFLDGYHGFMAVPSAFSQRTRENAFLSGGGYKYAQWGEGVCFMTIPDGYPYRPRFTGWFSDFENLDAPRRSVLGYGRSLASAFSGSTYDPLSHYRAAAVADFFEAQRMNAHSLRELSIAQCEFLIERLGDSTLVTPKMATSRGGFLAYRHQNAQSLVGQLRRKGVFADARGELIRFGPAPYTTYSELERAAELIRPLMAN